MGLGRDGGEGVAEIILSGGCGIVTIKAKIVITTITKNIIIVIIIIIIIIIDVECWKEGCCRG